MRTCQFGAKASKAASKQISTKEKKTRETPGCFQNKHPKLLWPDDHKRHPNPLNFELPASSLLTKRSRNWRHVSWTQSLKGEVHCGWAMWSRRVKKSQIDPMKSPGPIWIHRGNNFYQWSDFIVPIKSWVFCEMFRKYVDSHFLLAVQEVHLKPSWGYEQSGNIDELIGCFSTWFPKCISIQWLSLGVLTHIQQVFARSLWFWDILDCSLLDIRIFEGKRPFLRFLLITFASATFVSIEGYTWLCTYRTFA